MKKTLKWDGRAALWGLCAVLLASGALAVSSGDSLAGSRPAWSDLYDRISVHLASAAAQCAISYQFGDGTTLSCSP